MKYGTILLLVGLVALVSGCSHTVQGVQEDANQNAPIVQAAAQQAGQSIEKEGGSAEKTVSAKLSGLDHSVRLAMLGTEIKAKIITNKQLNSSKNSINVRSSTSNVVVTGHVETAEQKADVDNIARAVIAKDQASVSLHDDLTVSAG